MMILGNWLWPLRRRQLLSAASPSLKIMASAVLLERHPLERTVRWRTVANELSMTFVVRRCFPVLGREVVEGEQRVAILDQALDRLVVFDGPSSDEGVERRERILLGLSHPDLLQRPLGLRLLALRQLVEDIGGLVHPAALVSAIQISCSAPLAFDCWLFGSLLRTLAVLGTQQRCPPDLAHTPSRAFHELKG